MELSEKVINELMYNLNGISSKLLGKATLIKPIINKLKVSSIIEKEVKYIDGNDEVKKRTVEHKNIFYRDASEIIILNRLIAPISMYHVENWVDKSTCIGDLYNLKEECIW